MSDERNISDADAQAIADAIAGTSPEARLDRGKSSVNHTMREQLGHRKAHNDANMARLFAKPDAARNPKRRGPPTIGRGA